MSLTRYLCAKKLSFLPLPSLFAYMYAATIDPSSVNHSDVHLHTRPRYLCAKKLSEESMRRGSLFTYMYAATIDPSSDSFTRTYTPSLARATSAPRSSESIDR